MAKPMDKPWRYTRTSQTAGFHMSKQAVNLGVGKLASMTECEARDHLRDKRWGGKETIVCPHCGTISSHIFRGHDSRWKCQGCGKTFSVTSGTVFAHCKLLLVELLIAIFLFSNGASGVPALQIRRNCGRRYNTWYPLLHKIREGYSYGHNIGLVSGDIEVDGAWRLGRRSHEKRGKPQGGRSKKTMDDVVTEVNAKNPTTGVAQQKERNARKRGPRTAEYKAPMVEGRRLGLTGRVRSNVKGKGATHTRVGIGMDETPDVIFAMLSQYVCIPESILNSDGMTAYNPIGSKFKAHHQVDHSTHFSGPNGENNNLAEEFNHRMKRLERGIYMNVGTKYLQEYMSEAAFRSDARKMANGDACDLALHLATTIGPSRHWIGYTHSKHRDFERLVTGNAPADARGPAKGRDPNRMRRWPPR